jgi:hypothetical protein
LTQNASWIANRQTIGWDISGHNATRADSAVVSNANAGKNYRVSANPHVIFDHNWCGRRRHITLFDAMLVPIYDTQVMSQQTMAPNLDLLVGCNRCAVVDERMIAYRNMGTLVRNNFDRDNVSHQANAIPKFHISTSSEINATKKSHRQWYPGLTSNTKLSVEKCCSQPWVAKHFEDLASGGRRARVIAYDRTFENLAALHAADVVRCD